MASVKCEGVARIQVDGVDEPVEIYADVLSWDEVESYERDMGLERHYSATVEFEWGQVVWNVYEYPENVMQPVDAPEIFPDGRVLEDFKFSLVP